ncbi:MAG: CrcB family protein [Alphaproteobacteria bacterium]|nr:CrcB family protein [Alphaproteobacteria bacterium]
MWQTYLWVALGSGVGGAARLLCSDIAERLVGIGFPWGTLSVNVLGSLLIGVAAALVVPAGRLEPGGALQQFLMVGILGGYTTFTAFSLQTLDLARNCDLGKAAGYVAATIDLCLAGAGGAVLTGAGQGRLAGRELTPAWPRCLLPPVRDGGARQ